MPNSSKTPKFWKNVWYAKWPYLSQKYRYRRFNPACVAMKKKKYIYIGQSHQQNCEIIRSQVSVVHSVAIVVSVVCEEITLVLTLLIKLACQCLSLYPHWSFFMAFATILDGVSPSIPVVALATVSHQITKKLYEKNFLQCWQQTEPVQMLILSKSDRYQSFINQ